MPDDQVGPESGMCLAGFVDAVGVPDGVLEGTAAVVVRPACSAGRLVLDLPEARDLARRCLRDEGATPALGPDQVAGDVAELSGEVLMDE